MQNAKANPGSVLLNLSSFVSFKLFRSKSPSSSTAWLSFWGTVRAIAIKTQRQQLTKPHLLLNFDNVFLVCQYIPINIANIHFN